ncbi:hypothetical protein H1Z61_17130 [Bacillus aquiflavi]|uniref:Group-specific protein n=1 Tax=Bacillus aquiflavi TaxID=2672567 RepID=A0A6B3VY09_9BACI|nr:Imm47 family immunity protein [Bacillus aquiflavi]MBA4538800.1 hypothetical protein [Bacillus aquiflavi]NEY83150.1 hypothetical protein [Bacillus aquiflavi]UAC49048.1 hypothetical protein K6959_03865 [Bacillus aquiflavi]
MSQEKILLPGMWYGEKKSSTEVEFIKKNLTSIQTEEECILSIVELLKVGDFSVKPLLIQLMNTTKDDRVLNLCIRIFCSVCTHEDLKDSNNFKFLSDVSDASAHSFASGAVETLSYEVVPYLLAMLEDWEDTEIEQTIKNSLDFMLGYSKKISDEASLDEIGEFYLEEMKWIDASVYYYEKKPVFPGDLTKRLFKNAFISLQIGSNLKMYVVPSLLSIWSGEKCPVAYETVMDSVEMEKLQSYANTLSTMEWIKGKKYFYSTEI